MTLTNLPCSNWNWGKMHERDAGPWKIPSPESFYLVERWRALEMTELLDLGAGLGRHSLLFARNGFNVSALDARISSLKSIAQSASDENLTIDLRKGNMFRLPYLDNSFKSVLAFHIVSLTDTPGMYKAVSEVRRILKPGAETYLTLDSKASRAFTVQGPIDIDDNSRRMKTFGPDNNTTHCFVDETMIGSLMDGFEIIDVSHVIKPALSQKRNQPPISAYYHILARKR